jgi:hypothetical protein
LLTQPYWQAPVRELQVPTWPVPGEQSLFVQQFPLGMQALLPQALKLVEQLYEQAPVVALQLAVWPVPGEQSALVQQYEVGTQVVLPEQVL